jgi:ATP-dependent DNA helicase RecQ
VLVGAKGELTVPISAPDPASAAKAVLAEAQRHQVVQRSRTDMMRQFAEARSCRMQGLLNYFGDQLPGPCGHCDNCHGRADDPEPATAMGPFPLHSTVRHVEWGTGTVLGYERDRMTVLFDGVGYKTLSVAVVKDQGLLALDAGR